MYNGEYTYQVPFWKAEYHDPLLVSYKDNPLIEGLPPPYNRDQVYDLLKYNPGYEENYRQWPDHLRLHLILEASRFFQPLDIHFELEERFSRLIRAGYVGRNPLDLGYWPETKRRLYLMKQNSVFSSIPRVPIQGFTLIGISGIGKSRAIASILSLYPQVIQHNEYNGKRFTWTQLVWIKLECPPDSSISGLCHDFFHQVDRLLGTNYYVNHGLRGRPNVEQMRVAMGGVASDHSIGVIVIDEIQNLRLVRSDRADKMLSFLVQLDNTIGVPMVFVGTPKARAALEGEFRRARRAAGQGDIPWERMQKAKGEEEEKYSEWRVFLETLWKYQYVHEKSDLTDELSEVMYDESQGITDITIKLYFLSQIRAIERKQERITADIIRKTAQERLRSVQEFLFALRTNNKRLLRKYEDIQPIDLEGAVWQALRNVAPSLESMPGTSPVLESPTTGANDGRQEENGVGTEPGSQNTQQRSEAGGATRESKDHAAKVEGGLLEMAIKGREHGITAYDVLKKRGVIRDLSEYLVEEVRS